MTADRVTWFDPPARPVEGATIHVRPDPEAPMPDHEPALVAQAIHDVTCPEGPDCRDRLLHALGQPLAHTGVLAQFLGRLAQLEAADERPEIPGPDPQPVPRKRCSKCGTASCVEDAESGWYA